MVSSHSGERPRGEADAAADRTTCVVVGGGPAGMMLGLLLARAGIAVTVLEKHGDFLRDFRGDTVHPSTIRVLDELGLGEQFRGLPQSQLDSFGIPGPNGSVVRIGDFGRLPPPYNYVAMIPQWDFLNFLAEAAGREPSFSLRMNTEATGLLFDNGRVAGVSYRSTGPDGGTGELRAHLTVACDGRHSVLRSVAGLRSREYPVPFDVWWFRLPRHPEEPGPLAGIVPAFRGREALVTLFRKDFFQIAYLTDKGSDARLRAEGVESFRRRVAAVRPDFADRTDAIRSMDDVHVLDVRLDRLRRWYRDGLLCIGDAAHAMSPAGGVGINLAIQDAVAAAAILAGPLRTGPVPVRKLAKVQWRRTMPTVLIQAFQRLFQGAAFGSRSRGPGRMVRTVAFAVRRVPALRMLPARMIGFGPLPEHAPQFARR
ncbi:FAD-dependent oxidoreductase [Arthrobacter sp. I2-34]|uniref:FAD-dependent oxidoreductase n=1 Tax=Arthrobacter hankyongi TaxID=2904801 RepID=A0ABS9L1Q4_9MICC|nr:FAD-dependent oxidoreductase [Arthrobacter hankyongi]MCG2620591.1 FAD-dependent oxidoreductase [Arthrobacter hankyongi]